MDIMLSSSALMSKAIELLPVLVTSLITVAITIVLAAIASRTLSQLVGAALARTKLEALATQFIKTVVRIAVYVIAAVAILGTIGVDTTSLLAALGAAGLAIGLALRDSLSNLAAGLVLAFQGTFKKGDTIEVSGIVGTVTAVDLLTTELQTPDNRRVTIPNGKLMNSDIINFSAYDTRRIEFIVGISYEDDAAEAAGIIRHVIAEAEFCLDQPEPIVGIDTLADFGQNLLVRVWVPSEFVLSGKLMLLDRIKKAFDDKGVTIPFPRYEVHQFQDGILIPPQQ
ncbi:MAG: mechanosensitive ion channel family protein [Gammaproteobacteria bacterium]|nr:mechanosensitive ion channel family protein [Gammaproteobacteria bacterium]